MDKKDKDKDRQIKYNESATVMRRGKARAGQGKVVKQVVVRAGSSRQGATSPECQISFIII